MSIKVKAIERKLKFQKEAVGEYRYVLQPELYNKLSAAKVIQEAALRSGISKGVIQAGWDAIGAVLVAWATEGHSVAIPGLGTLRFGVRAKAVADVNKVGTDLITSRRVIFTPNVDIKKELKSTSLNITCIDRNGEIVKRVTSADKAEVEDNEEMYEVALSAGNGGSVEGSGNYEPNASVTIKATASQGYKFVKWSDGNTNAERTFNISDNMNLTAEFSPVGGQQTTDNGQQSGGDPDDSGLV